VANFNLSDYQTVEERIQLFWAKYPNGRIINTIMFDDGERVVIKSEVYLDKEDDRPTTVDFAEEVKSSSHINKVSRIENGTTSATGRALSLLGGDLSPKGKRPSRTEMEKVQRSKNQPSRPEPQPVAEPAADTRRQQGLLDRLNALPDYIRADAKKQFLENFGKPLDLPVEQIALADEFIAQFETEPPF
jgi:hypothetical protein